VLVTAGEGYEQADFSLGTETKTHCIFYKEAIDAGNAIRTVLNGVMERATIERISAYRVTSTQGVPIIFLEGRYAVDAPDGKQGGSLKLSMSPRLQTPVLCFLDEPGYLEAFTSAVTGIMSSLTVKEPANVADYSEIWATSVDGLALGYQWFQMFDEGQGKRSTVSVTAAFVPAGPGQLSTSDDVEVLKSDASGVLEGTFTEVEGGEVAHDLTLSRSGKSKYSVSGKVQGKDFKSEFSAQKLPDDVATYRLLLQNHTKTTQLTIKEFDPSLDPSGPTEVRYAIDGKAKTVAIQMGELSLLGTLAEQGLVSQVTSTMGGREIKQEIIHRSGKF
jgi:hypothetical protein